MKFVQLLTEGRNRWDKFSIKKCDQRWTFTNNTTGKRNFIKLGDQLNDVSGIQKFLQDLQAMDETVPKTRNDVDYKQFAHDVCNGKKAHVHVKSGNFEQIKKTWILDN